MSYDDRIAEAPLLTCVRCAKSYHVQTPHVIRYPYICLACMT